MKYLLLTTSLLAAFAAADLPAQTQNRVFLDNGDATSGSSNTFPWSQEGLRYQTIFPASTSSSRNFAKRISASLWRFQS